MLLVRLLTVPALLIVLAGCVRDNPNVPSLSPRAAEAIDPRIPIPDRAETTPADARLGASLDRQVQSGRAGAGAFEQALAIAERLAAAAGASQSESWIVAQEALSAAVAARSPLPRALAEIDALAAEQVQARGGITPADQRQFEAALRELGPIDARQSARIKAVQSRLGG